MTVLTRQVRTGRSVLSQWQPSQSLELDESLSRMLRAEQRKVLVVVEVEVESRVHRSLELGQKQTQKYGQAQPATVPT